MKIIKGSQDFMQCSSTENVTIYRKYFPLYSPWGTNFTHVVEGEEFLSLLLEGIWFLLLVLLFWFEFFKGEDFDDEDEEDDVISRLIVVIFDFFFLSNFPFFNFFY